jgi:hypothetical protein
MKSGLQYLLYQNDTPDYFDNMFNGECTGTREKLSIII